VGGLIALFERAVGLYASLIGVNAYHQPGVEAGKKAAGGVVALKRKIAAALQAAPGNFVTVEELAEKLGEGVSTEHVFKILEHLAKNRSGGVKKRPRTPWYLSRYGV